MKKIPCIYLVLALIIALGACNDPVFYNISVEQPIADPLIAGSPANFVVYDNKVYVASGRSIYSYDGTGWNKIPSQPDGRILQLAATDNYLYALSLKGSDEARYAAYYDGGSWNDINVNNAQSIFAANNVLFICAGNGNVEGNAIFYANEGAGNASPIGGTDGKSLLNGMAYNGTGYFLCTKESGIFYVSGGSLGTATPIPESSSINFTGIISIGSSVVAITRNDGYLFTVTAAGIDNKEISFGRYSTGALAVWENPADPAEKLLLAGRQDSLVYSVDSGYTYGYMEIDIDSSGIKAGSAFREPGTGSPSTVSDNARYVSTIGKNPVNHIFQTPKSIDSEMILFASTHKSGVWSYRDRENGPHWNAEE